MEHPHDEDLPKSVYFGIMSIHFDEAPTSADGCVYGRPTSAYVHRALEVWCHEPLGLNTSRSQAVRAQV